MQHILPSLSLLLFSSPAFANEPVIVAKTLGIEKLSESYLITEELVNRINKEYDFGVRILTESPCAAVACQQESATEEKAIWLITIEISEDKKTANLSLFDTQKQKNRRTKTVTGDSWEEVRAKLPTTLLKMGKSTFSKMKIPEAKTETSSSSEEGSEALAEEGSETVAEEGAETLVEEAVQAEIPQNNAPPFSDFRVRGSGSFAMYQYTQSAEEGFEFISPDVSLLTILPNVQVDTEYWLPNNTFGVNVQADIGPFGYKLGEESSIKTIHNIRAGLLYHYPLENIGSLEVGLAYHSTNGLGFQFTEERTSVESTTQSIVGGALSLGIVTRVQGFDVRADISETFTPLPKHTRIRLLAEKPLSVLPLFNMMLTAHGGIQCTMRHFSFEIKTETGNVFDLQAGVFGGAGVSF